MRRDGSAGSFFAVPETKPQESRRPFNVSLRTAHKIPPPGQRRINQRLPEPPKRKNSRHHRRL
jgi:hypothetical protein